MRYKITLSYDGTAFCGWQIQPSAPSVQQTLERALSTLLGEAVCVTGAGRTDTGVHASYYVAHFDTDARFPREGCGSGAPVLEADGPGGLDCALLCYKLNAILPDSVAVFSVEPASPEFHARFDAVRREYVYFLHRCKDPFLAHSSYYYNYPELDFEAMNRAAAALIGRHDFSCFEKSGADSKTSVCTVFEAGWHPYIPTLAQFPEPSADCAAMNAPTSQYWYFRISADRFLRNMVRAIVGTLLEIGRGKRSIGSVAEIIGPVLDEGATAPDGVPGQPEGRASRRSLAGESVPGHALFLTNIDY